MMQIKFFVFAVFAAPFLIAGQNAFACSCAEKSTVLDEFEDSELVIIAKAVSLEKIRLKDETEIPDNDAEDTSGSYKKYESAKMIVEKVYKGNAKVGDELMFAQGKGADCIWTFDNRALGKQFLFYLGKPSKNRVVFDNAENDKDAPLMYYAGTCGRSNGVDDVFDDLRYLDNLAKVRGKTRLSGTLNSWDDEPTSTGIPIKIIGKTKTFAAKTDKNGFFEIYDLPPGEYLVEPKIPFGWKIDKDFYKKDDVKILKNRIRLTIKEKRHTALDLFFEIDNAIRGKIISPTGKPMTGVCLKAVSTELEAGDFLGKFACTNARGEFEISTLSPDNYILVINEDGKISNEKPFGRLFYPGVAEQKNAAILSIDAGKFLNDIDIQIPQIAEMLEISGRFLYVDDNPVAEEWVEFNPSQSAVFDRSFAKTDKLGRFTIEIPRGAGGILFGSKYYYSEDKENCPKINEIVQAIGNSSMKTNRFEFDANENLTDVKLTFPFPFCAKEK